MGFARIVVKNNYAKKGDLVFRRLIRAYQKIGAKSLVNGDRAIILGIVTDGVFHELFTGKPIEYSYYHDISDEKAVPVIERLKSDEELWFNIELVIRNLVFKEHVVLPYEEDINAPFEDRKIEAEAYECGLGPIDPYDRGAFENTSDAMEFANNFADKVYFSERIRNEEKRTQKIKYVGEKKN